MYKKYIVENIYNVKGQKTSFSALYGVKNDNTCEIINTDYTETIENMYRMLTDVTYNHEIEEKRDFDHFLVLSDFFSYDYTDIDGIITIDGLEYQYEITINPDIPDELSSRIMINDIYYHF